jgi:NDP-sugar pyrophosphorylase family protein
MQAVILAGGKGTRLAPYTTVLPKPLMPIGDMPILEIIIRQLRRSGFTRIELATGHLSALIEAYFGDGKHYGVHISYHREERAAGTAGPLALLESALEEHFMVMNGDVLTDLEFAPFFLSHCERGALLTAATCKRNITLPLGAIVRDGDGTVSGYIEKPTYEFECSAGIYAATRAAVQYIERDRAFDLPELVRALIAAGRPVHTHAIPGFWLDIGTPDDYRCAVDTYAANLEALLAEPSRAYAAAPSPERASAT